MKQREAKRRFWSALMARYEGSGRSRKEFAAEAGVGLAIFQYWLYKLRRERRPEAVAERKAAVPEVRLVPVTIRARPTVPAQLEIRVAGVRLRVAVGADAGYVAQLACALRDGRPC